MPNYGVSSHLQLMTPNLILTKRILFYISPQEREISVPILSRSAFPHSCTKFAFPRAHVPKMPGMWERGSAGTRNQEHAPTSGENHCSTMLFKILLEWIVTLSLILGLLREFASNVSEANIKKVYDCDGETASVLVLTQQIKRFGNFRSN